MAVRPRLYCILRPDGTVIQRSLSDQPKLCWELAISTDKRCAKASGNPLRLSALVPWSTTIYRLKRLSYRRCAAKVVPLVPQPRERRRSASRNI